MNDIHQRKEYFEKEIANAVHYKDKLKLYRQYSYLLSPVDPEKSYEIILQGVKYSLVEKDLYEQNVMIVLKAICLIELRKYDQALSLLLEVKEYFLENNKMDFYAKVLSNIAVVYFELENYNQAIFIWKDLISNYIAPDNIAFRHLVLNNLISAYQNTFLYNNYSQIQIREILKYYEDETIEKDQNYSNALDNLAVSYRLSHEYQKSIEESQKLLHFATTMNFNKLQYVVNYNLFLCYHAISDEQRMIKYLLNTFKLSKKIPSLYLKEDLYKALYLYYKNKNEIAKSFEFLESLYNLGIEKNQIKLSVDKIDSLFELNSIDQKNKSYLKNFVKINTFEWNREIYIENIKGDTIKVNIDSIVSVISTNKFIKIYFPNNQASIFKKSLKDFVDLLYDKFGNNHLFFNTNLRKELVNLYWLSSFDKSTKKIFLNVIGSEYIYSVTRSQLPKLREFLMSK